MKLPPQISDTDHIRSRIATLERALAALQLDLSVDDPEDELSWLNLRVIDNGEDDEDSEDDLWGPLYTIESLVMAGLAKKIPGGDSVIPGAVLLCLGAALFSELYTDGQDGPGVSGSLQIAYQVAIKGHLME